MKDLSSIETAPTNSTPQKLPKRDTLFRISIFHKTSTLLSGAEWGTHLHHFTFARHSNEASRDYFLFPFSLFRLTPPAAPPPDSPPPPFAMANSSPATR